MIEALIGRHPPTESVLREKTLLEGKYERLYSAHMDFLLLLTEQTPSDATWQSGIYEKFTKYVNIVDNYVRSVESKGSSNLKYRMQKLNLPNFDGNVRNFPRFLKDFTQLILPCISKKEYAFTLRQCLSADVLSYLGNGDDFDEMVNFLKTSDGDPG